MGRNRAVGDTYDVQYLVGSGQTVRINYGFDAYFVTGITAVGITFILDPNAVEGDTVQIADSGSHASVGTPITVTAPAGMTINGAPGSASITVAGTSAQFVFNSSTRDWAAVFSTNSGAPPLARGNAVNSEVNVTGVAALALAANPGRIQALFVNTGANIIYLGQAGVTTGTGLPLNPGASFVDDASISAWFAITAGGASTLVISEVS